MVKDRICNRVYRIMVSVTLLR